MSNNKNKTKQDDITDYCRMTIVPIERKLRFSFFASIISFIISATVLLFLCTESTVRVDYITILSFIVAVLTILVTITLANQIINYKEFKDATTGHISQLSKEIDENKEEIEQNRNIVYLESFLIISQSISISIKGAEGGTYLLAFQALGAYTNLTDKNRRQYYNAKETAISHIIEIVGNLGTGVILFYETDLPTLRGHISIAEEIGDRQLIKIAESMYKYNQDNLKNK